MIPQVGSFGLQKDFPLEMEEPKSPKNKSEMFVALAYFKFDLIDVNN